MTFSGNNIESRREGESACARYFWGSLQQVAPWVTACFACVPTPNSHGHRSAGLFHSGLLEINFSSQSLVTKADEDSRSNGQKHDFVAVFYIFQHILPESHLSGNSAPSVTKRSPARFGDSNCVIALLHSISITTS